VRERLLPLLTSSLPQIRSQLEPILQKILQCDFPHKWPNFVDIACQLLATNEAGSLYAGLQCILSLARTYRYKAGEHRAEFDRIVQITFDPVLAIANRLLEETSTEAGEMLRIAIKCYKHAIYVCRRPLL
jgi:importin-7